MNKKIKQFSEQAIHDDNGETLHFLPSDRYIEKFARLIIQDCINQVSTYSALNIHNGFELLKTTNEHYEEWGFIKGTEQGYNDAVLQIADGLRQHFGVEE
jgi:hypothetical protein